MDGMKNGVIRDGKREALDNDGTEDSGAGGRDGRNAAAEAVPMSHPGDEGGNTGDDTNAADPGARERKPAEVEAAAESTWEQPTAPAGNDQAGAEHKEVLDIFDFQRSRDRIPYAGPVGPGGAGGPVATYPDVPMAVPVASPIQTAQKTRITPPPDAGGVRKEKLPSVEELTALADEAYENYNFIEAVKHIKNAMLVDATFPPARDLYDRMRAEHLNLFEGAGGTAPSPAGAPGFGGDAADWTDRSRDATVGHGLRDMTKRDELVHEKRDIGETGLVKTRSTRLEQKVYVAPKTLGEQVSPDEIKGFAEKKGFMSGKGSALGLILAIAAIGIIVVALYWTGMLTV